MIELLELLEEAFYLEAQRLQSELVGLLIPLIHLRQSSTSSVLEASKGFELGKIRNNTVPS